MAYAQEQKLALAAIKRAGVLLTFTQTVDTYSTATQTVLHAPTVYQMWCLIVKPAVGLGEGYAEDGSTVNYNQSLVAAALGVSVAPRVGDTLILQGNKWTIIAKGETEPDGTAIIYRLSIRRG